MSAQAKDRITCHILDTSAGRPARGVRVRLELVPSPPPSASPTSSSPSPGAAATTTSTGFPPAPQILHHGQAQPAPTFESQTDEDGRVRTWLPYSAANASGEVPVYTLDDVLGAVEASPSPSTAEEGGGEKNKKSGGSRSSRWTLRFDTEAYYAAAGVDCFFPEVAVSFRVEPGQHYHVPLLLSPYSYTTYRGS